MKLTVTGRNLEITNAIKTHLNNKINKKVQSLNESTNIHVSLHADKHRHIAEVTMKVKGFTAHADEETNDLYKSMDNALEKIEKQIKKYKERTKDQKIKNGVELKNSAHCQS